MRSRILSVLCVAAVAALVTSGLVGSAQAEVIYDAFGPPTSSPTLLNSALWTATPYIGTSSFGVADSVVTVVDGQIQSTSSWLYRDLAYTFGGTSIGPTGFGLAGPGVAIMMRNDVVGGAYELFTSTGGGPLTTWTTLSDATTPTIGDVFTFVWAKDSVELYKGATLIGSTTSNVSSSALSAFAFAYKDPSGGSIAIDTVSVVPEPGALCLLGVGGVLALSRRRR